MANRRGFITPPPQNSSDLGAILLLGVNQNADILSLIDGALSYLKEGWNWQKINESNMTPEESAQYFEEIERVFIVSLCQAIADCISDPDSPAHQAIVNLADSRIELGAKANPSEPVFSGNDSGIGLEQDRTLASGACDPDIIFGFTTQVVELLNTTIGDCFDIIEIGSNLAERANIVLDNIPLFSEGLDLIDQLLEEVVEQYDAQYTTAIANKYACDLKCLMEENPDCTLTFSDMAEYFYSRAGTGVAQTAYSEFLSVIMTGTITGENVVHVAHALLCSALQYGSTWLSLDVSLLQRLVQSFLNDPNPDWVTLCDECPADCQPSGAYNFTIDTQCFEVGTVDGGAFTPTSKGEYVSGIGFKSVQTAGGSATVEIYYQIPQATLTSLSFAGNRQGSQNAYTQAYILKSDNTYERVIDGTLDNGDLSWSGSKPNVIGVSFLIYGGNTGTQEYRITSANIGVS